MKSRRKLIIKITSTLFALLIAFLVEPVFAQSKIMEVNDQKTGGANLKIGNSQAKFYDVGQVFTAPFRVETTNEKIKLSANTNSQEIWPHAKHEIKFIGGVEIHTQIDGHIEHDRNVPTRQYVVNTPQVDVPSGNTKFSVIVDASANTTKIKVFHGHVNTFQKQPVVINTSKNTKEPKKKFNNTVYKSISQGEEERTFYNLNPVGHGSVQETLNFFKQQLEQNKMYNKPIEQLADDNALVGELYLELGSPSESLSYLKTALGYYDQVYYSQQDKAEIYLNLTEAFLDLGRDQEDEFYYYYNQAKKLLLSENVLNKEDLYYAEFDGDSYLQKLIREDLSFNYYNLGWLSEIMYDDTNAAKYYQLAEQYDY